MNRKAFYAALRRRESGVFGTSLSQQQVTGIEGILDAFLITGDGRRKTLAYALATAYHETGRRMVPVREGFAKTDLGARRAVNALARKRGPNSAVAKYSKPAGPYGHVYYGRGRVQETWLDNYRATGDEFGIDFVKYPDKRLDPVIDAQILFSGLLDGRWNGRRKGIAYYLPDQGPDDLKNARRTVNITDKWSEIADYYRSFLKAIKEAGGVPKLPAPGNEPFSPPLTQKQITDALQRELAADPVLSPKNKPKDARQPVPATTTPETPSRPSAKASGAGMRLLNWLLGLITFRKEQS